MGSTIQPQRPEYPEPGGGYATFIDLLETATRPGATVPTTVLLYRRLVVPGIAQTEDYANMILASGGELSSDNMNPRMAARQRQWAARDQGLTRHTLDLHLILDEHLLLRPHGTQTVVGQLRFLLNLATRGVTIQVIPFTAMPCLGFEMPSISVFEVPEEEPQVILELPAPRTGESSNIVTGSSDKPLMLHIVRQLRTMVALPPPESLRLIEFHLHSQLSP